MTQDIESLKAKLVKIRKDFEVRYRFFGSEDGGRTRPPHQFYRSDWSYDGDDIEKTGIFMIWPIFLDENGAFIERDSPVPVEGIAQMFIVNDEFRTSIHAKLLAPGVRGYFMEGPNRVAEAVVTRLLSIADTIESR